MTFANSDALWLLAIAPLALEPADAGVWVNLARARKGLGDRVRAREALDRAVDVGPTSALAWASRVRWPRSGTARTPSRCRRAWPARSLACAPG